MAFSLALIVLAGLISDYLFRRLRMPGLIGMLLTGIVMGPYVLDIINPQMLAASSDFRMLALIVILLRAGLETQRDTLNKVGKTAILMSIVPAILEGFTITLLAPPLLGITLLEGAILGAIIAAVSPAVVVPFMIRYIEERRGTEKGIPTMILAASSLDDVFVIVVFSMLMGVYAGDGGSIFFKIFEVPVSITMGLIAGTLMGFILYWFFITFRPRATKKSMALIGAAVLLTWIEDELKSVIPLSALLAVMTVGFIILEKSETMAHQISRKLSKVWVMAEILLFVLVGAQVNIHVAWDAGLTGAILIAIALVARSLGTYISVKGAGFTTKEKLFCVVAYIPKATVQAAIGSIPLAAGVPGGEIILAVAVLSILLTAPLGALGIEMTGRRWLQQEPTDAK